MTSTDNDTATHPKPQAASGRDAQGRFTKGNPGGPGNPYARRVAALRRAMLGSISEDDLKHLIFVVKMRAEGGDMAAAKLLFQYVIGKAPETVDPDRLDADEWRKLQERSRPPQEMSEVMAGMPAPLACDLTNVAWPCRVAQELGGPLLAGIANLDERDAQQAASRNPREVNKRAAKKAAKQAARRQRKQRHHAAAPMTNGDNGAATEVWPLPNGNTGDPDPGDWLRHLVHEAMTASQNGNGAEGA